MEIKIKIEISFMKHHQFTKLNPKIITKKLKILFKSTKFKKKENLVTL